MPADQPCFAKSQRVQLIGPFGDRMRWPGTVLAVLDASQWESSLGRWEYAVALDDDRDRLPQRTPWRGEVTQQLRAQGAPEDARIFCEEELRAEESDAR